jgi:hypothetical protein
MEGQKMMKITSASRSTTKHLIENLKIANRNHDWDVSVALKEFSE